MQENNMEQQVVVDGSTGSPGTTSFVTDGTAQGPTERPTGKPSEFAYKLQLAH